MCRDVSNPLLVLPSLLLTASVLWACAARADLVVQDDMHQPVHLAAPAARIVSLAPHITELLFAVGAGPALVGAVDYSDYPEAAKAVPRVGSYNAVDLEAVVALRPQLIVAWHSSTPPNLIDQLRRLGYPVFMSEPRRLDDIAGSLRRLGELSGHAAAGRQVAEAFTARADELRARYARRAPVTVFYQVWDAPIMTLNGQHIVSELLALCGGRNIFAELDVLAPAVDAEAVLTRNPQVIIASGPSAARPPWLDDWRRFAHLEAVRRDNLYAVSPDTLDRATPRLLDGMEQLCDILDRARTHLPNKKTAPD